ncbi:MAG: toxin, partial [Solirubrobacteraceae bacterium]
KAARDAAGWDVCLGELERLVAGQPTTPPGKLPTEAWTELYEEYQRHGLPASAPLPAPENGAT